MHLRPRARGGLVCLCRDMQNHSRALIAVCLACIAPLLFGKFLDLPRYRVVIDTSAAWSSAEERKSAPKVMALRTSPVTVETARAAAGSTGPARPIALGFVCVIRFGGGASKAVAAAAQQSALSARAMLLCALRSL